MKGPTVAAAATLETAINAALTLDTATRQRLTQLAGTVVHIQCTQPQLDLFVLPQAQRLALAATWEDNVDARLVGTSDDFLKLARSANPAAELINGPVSVHGDSQVLQQLQRLLRDLDLDWEAPLSRALGDVVGHQLGRAFRWGSGRTRYAGNRLLEQGRDWLNEESELVAIRWEVDRFCDDVDALVADTDRLEARIRRLRQRRTRA